MSRFVKVKEAINLPLLGSDDYLMHGKGRMLTWAPYVYNDMNLAVLKKAFREIFKIDKRTRTIDLPCPEQDLCSVSIVDHKGVIWPCYRNDKLHDDLVVIPADKDCNCENRCAYHLCNTIKGYEAISAVVNDTMPDGTPVSFTCVNRRGVNPNGYLYIERQYPEHVFTNGVWTNTILQTESKTLCKLETDDRGCVCDTEQNVNLVCEACGINHGSIPFGGTASTPPSPGTNEWIYFVTSKLDFLNVQCGGHPFFREGYDNIYNVSELGNRLIFPPHFPFDSVLIRWFGVPKLSEMEIPMVAVPCFATGLKWFDVRWSDTRQQLEPKFGSDYKDAKWGLFGFLNKYTLAEYGQMLAPKRPMPSYWEHHEFGDGNHWEGRE